MTRTGQKLYSIIYETKRCVEWTEKGKNQTHALSCQQMRFISSNVVDFLEYS